MNLFLNILIFCFSIFAIITLYSIDFGTLDTFSKYESCLLILILVILSKIYHKMDN
ncbi:hypothetical protein LCGC14_1125900 [marine sediment metagenome]|uniref:Uncharacterized protein n=1 Tax=marine sediment metagenome TaxID=412755 RepID=A0A0F9Q8D1_9ZZZZ